MESAGSTRQFEGEQSRSGHGVYVSLTYDNLDASKAMARVKSPKAGAVVLFAGTQSCDNDAMAPAILTLSP